MTSGGASCAARRVVVGTRTAAFAPVADLGLVIVDEAHDGGYKSDRTPRYDGRWVAFLAGAALSGGARVVLGTATPDLRKAWRAFAAATPNGRGSSNDAWAGRRPSRSSISAPELAAGNRSIFSAPLADALGALHLAASRRCCSSTGAAPPRSSCAAIAARALLPGVQSALRVPPRGRFAALSPLRPDGRASGPLPSSGSAPHPPFRRGYPVGRGRGAFALRAPARRAASTRTALAARRGFESIYDDFREGRTDVLVGTQLAAKGLDLPSVTLAAVIAADVTLNLPDYSAAERTFQLLAQVAGRAGRGPLPGMVVIQTYSPGHYAVRTAAALDVDAFADEEPCAVGCWHLPFGVLARLLVADADRERAEERGRKGAEAVAGPRRGTGHCRHTSRGAGRYRMQVVVRAPDAQTRASALERVPSGVAIDVDPESLL